MFPLNNKAWRALARLRFSQAFRYLGQATRLAGRGDKTTVEQIKLIQELDPDDKTMIFKMIDTMLTKKKFKDFFNNNIAAL